MGKFIINRQQAIKAFERVAFVVKTKSPTPAWQYVSVKVSSGKIRMHGVSDAMCVLNAIDVSDSVGECAFAVRPGDIVDRLRRLSGEHVDCELDATGMALHLRAGRVSYRMPVEAYENGPRELTRPSERPVDIPSATLAALLRPIVHSMSPDPTRANLHCALFESDGSTFTVVATNGHTLSMSTAEVSLPAFSAVVPAPTVTLIQSVLDGSESVQVVFLPSGGLVRVGDLEVLYAGTDAVFPAWKQVIPKSSVHTCKVDSAELLGAVNAVSAASPETSKGVRVSMSSDRILLEAQSPDRGDATAEVSPKSYTLNKGKTPTVAMSARYIADCLRVTPGEVDLGMSGELDPVVVSAPSVTHIIMPMRA